MNSNLKNVTYTTTNTYETLNTLTPKTENIWIVFHGIGFLSKFFLRYFDDLEPEKNYIIAPQAPSKYYLKNEYKHVGASWLTKENTKQETLNLFNYINAVLVHENIPTNCNITVLGFSQGVSIALRYLTHAHLKCNKLVLYAGGIPVEVNKNDLTYLATFNTEIVSIIGSKDEYLSPERLVAEREKLDLIFGNKVNFINFDGGHEMRKEIINSLVK